MDVTSTSVNETGTAESKEIQGPQSLAEFNGQSGIKENLKVYIKSALLRNDRIDHILFHGPPGLGKTTLAEIISKELGVRMRQLTAPMIEKPSDVVHVLAGLDDRDVLFIDEIHRLPVKIAELLYPVMQDFRLDLIIGNEQEGRVESIPLPPFTLIGATTHSGKLPGPLSMRFPIKLGLDLYTDAEMHLVLKRAAQKLKLVLDDAALDSVCRCSRGTPRIANGLMARIRDFAVVDHITSIDQPYADSVLTKLGYDEHGFSVDDRRYMKLLRTSVRPMGLRTLSASMNVPEETIENDIEPYLMRLGIVVRTERGRTLSAQAKNPFGKLAQKVLAF